MRLTILLAVLSLSICNNSIVLASDPNVTKPRLVVGIVVDQMRYDYITRYWGKFGNDGFKKLCNEGFNCTNAQYNYVPTYTGPGHASVYTGTTPATHGIISNDWFDKKTGRSVYVTDDSVVTGVGTTSTAGKMSAKNLLSTTISDELRLASNFRSKVIGVALKDRSSILPAGASANAAYWYEGKSGNWISSNWYFKTLPEWVVKFNNQKLPANYLKTPWTTLLPIDQYTESTPDDSPYEDLFPRETKPVFPHNFFVNDSIGYDVIKTTPYGNQLTKEFALSAMKNESLGQDEFTDLLAISFSSTDYVGHQFGTHAIETEDIYLRLDQELADLIKQVESYAGKGNVLFFLTADHAAIPNVQFLADHKFTAGIISTTAINDSLQKHLNSKYGNQKWIRAFDNDQFYLDYVLLEQNKIDIEDISNEICRFLLQFKGVAGALTAGDLMRNEYTTGIRSHIQKGFNIKRSGDVVMILEPGYIEYKAKGTTHGSGYMYDNHVPMLFYGWNIPKGKSAREIYITDIAPTLAQLLGIQAPSGTSGSVILELLK